MIFSHIELKTGNNLSSKQKMEVRKEFRSGNHESQISVEANALARDEFDNAKADLIKEWEQNTGKQWPTYSEDVPSLSSENLWRTKGSNYDAHHIIEESYGGPPKWWNITPASVTEHIDIHHGADALIKNVFH